MKKNIRLLIIAMVFVLTFSVIDAGQFFCEAFDEQSTTADEQDEIFIEHFYETDEEVEFTLEDVLSQQTDEISLISEDISQSTGSGERYTAPYNLNTTDSVFTSSESITKILYGSPYSKVENVNAMPYCKTVLIYITFERSDGTLTSSVGTGFMVGNKVLVTAGHVIWHTTLKTGPKEIRVILRYDEDHTSKDELAEVETYFHPYSWVFSSKYYSDPDNVDTNYDWCYMTMSADIGKTYTGWFGIGTTSGSITDKAIYVTGYPNVSGERFHQYESSGVLNSVSDYRISHTCSTNGGHSGSPLYSSSYVVWAIHTSERNSTTNGGVRITSTLYELLVNKKAATD